MCGNQTTSEMNTNHEQVQLCERDDAKVGSYSSACLDVLDPGLIDHASPHKVSAHETISRRISVWCEPQTSGLLLHKQRHVRRIWEACAARCYVRGIAHEDFELVLLVNGSVCVTKDCEKSSRTQFNGIDVEMKSC